MENECDVNVKTRTVLWVSAHPEAHSLNGTLRSDAIGRLRSLGHRVLESDLYAMAWDPVLGPRDAGEGLEAERRRFSVSADTKHAYLSGASPVDVTRERAKLVQSDAVVLQFPLWWYSMPAMLKGWFDRVFVSGMAFGTDEGTGKRLRFEQGPFVGKRALVVTTLGDRAGAIGPRGISGELDQLLYGLLHGTLAYTGMQVLQPWVLPSADHLSEPEFPNVRRSLFVRLDQLFDDEPIAYRKQFAGEYAEDWSLADDVLPGETGLQVHVERR